MSDLNSFGIERREPSRHWIKLAVQTRDIMELSTEEDIRLAEKVDEDMISIFFEYLEDLGFTFDQTFFSDLKKDLEVVWKIIDEEKSYHDMPRPYEISEDMNLEFKRRYISTTGVGGSYPSGHAMSAKFVAIMLCDKLKADLEPEECAKLHRIASRIAFSRIQIGVHSLQDINYGVYLAEELCKRLYLR